MKKTLAISSIFLFTLFFQGCYTQLAMFYPDPEIEINEEIATTLDMSHAFTGIEIKGDSSTLFLNRHLPIDLRNKNFPDLSSASSAIHHVSVKLFRLREKEFKLFIPRGFALSIWEILLETASQFGYEIKDS